jgi:uncharacterized Zn finger protein
MKSPVNISKFLSEEFIEKHAIPSNIKYGRAIYNRKAIKPIESSDVRVAAWVGGLNGVVVEGGGSKRRVEFIALKTGLQWNCTGNPKNHQIFCKHCVALALWLLRKRPKK